MAQILCLLPLSHLQLCSMLHFLHHQQINTGRSRWTKWRKRNKLLREILDVDQPTEDEPSTFSDVVPITSVQEVESHDALIGGLFLWIILSFLEPECPPTPILPLPTRKRDWAIKTWIKRSCINGLLQTLQPDFPGLPRDYRTLMRTPRTSSLKIVNPGQYVHLGLLKAIERIVCADSLIGGSVLSIQLRIDGLTLWNSSVYQLWPIMGRIIHPVESTSFFIGI